MSTLSQLITDTSYLLGDPQGNRWKTAIANPPVLGTNDLQYLLNVACDLYNAATGVYHTTLPVAVNAGQATAVIVDSTGSPPYGKLLRLEDANGRALIPRTAEDLNVTTNDTWRSTAPGTPGFFIRGLDNFGTVRLYPPPAVNGSFLAYVVARPVSMLISNDLPFIGSGPNREATPAHHHHALPFYAASIALLWNRTSRDQATADQYLAEFEKRAKQGAAEVHAAMTS